MSTNVKGKAAKGGTVDDAIDNLADTLSKAMGGDEGGDEGGEGGEDEGGGEGGEGMEKGMRTMLEADEDLSKSLNAAPVLDKLVDGIDDGFDSLRDTLTKGFDNQEYVNKAVLGGLAGVVDLIKGLGVRQKELEDQLSKALNQPAARRAASTGTTRTAEKFDTPAANADLQGMAPGVVQGKLQKAMQLRTPGHNWAQLSVIFDRTGTLPEDALTLLKSL